MKASTSAAVVPFLTQMVAVHMWTHHRFPDRHQSSDSMNWRPVRMSGEVYTAELDGLPW